jgi:hypothetical protein
MSVVLKLIASRLSEKQAGLAGKYVSRYDPRFHPPGTEYAGGILEVTDDPQEALRFAGAEDAIKKWRQPYGVGPDGLPHRPLTAWIVQVELAPERGDL